LANLNEDPQLSQAIYYGLKDFPVKVGRRNEKPQPHIIFGGITVQAGHGQFTLLANGLIQLEVTNPAALEQTLVNGKCLPADEPVQTVNHLDTIYFG